MMSPGAVRPRPRPLVTPRALLWCEIYFNSLNRVGVAHKCDGRSDRRTDRQTDRQTDRTAFSNSALYQRQTRPKTVRNLHKEAAPACMNSISRTSDYFQSNSAIADRPRCRVG